VTTAQATDSLYIPGRALHPEPTGGYTVLVKRGGATRTQTVQIGIRDDQYVEIRSGLATGDRVQLT
jgi:macrolide-specific efflux system membrane fusion protein